MYASICRKLARGLARAVLPKRFRAALLRRQAAPVSRNYRILDTAVVPELLAGWQHAAIPSQQWAAFQPVLEDLRAGRPREDFHALTSAVAMTGERDPMVIEVGCGGAWNYEVLSRQLGHPIQYIGVDYSVPMVEHAAARYPEAKLLVGDATKLPLRDAACDILLSGTVLMHVLDFRSAILESRRVAREWCILHTVPVAQRRATTILCKEAYGQPTVEVIFNEGELRALLAEAGLAVVEAFESLPYDLMSEIGETTATKTFLCRVRQ